MCGNETLATEVSRISMKVASITENAISQGLRLGLKYWAPNGSSLMALLRTRAASPSNANQNQSSDSQQAHQQPDPEGPLKIADLDGGPDGHAGAQQVPVIQFVKRDFDRHALHHFDVIPHGILGRQQAKKRAAASLDTFDMTIEISLGKSIHSDAGRLAGPEQLQLGFLEIGHDPQLLRHQGHERLPDLSISALLD